MKHNIFFIICIVFCSLNCQTKQDGWIPLFDGKTLTGWKGAEHPNSFRIENDAILCDGPRAHLFYNGTVQNATFNNFEYKVDVKTHSGSNSGVYFHTEFQEEGWPAKGCEAQVNNTYPKTGNYYEFKKTGSLYGIRNLFKSPVKDNEWFTMHIIVQGNNVKINLNDRLVVDWTEPEKTEKESKRISSGTFAFQCHDPKSKVYYKNIFVKPLPDDLPTPGSPIENRELDEKITKLHQNNFPLIDFHVHLKGGLTMELAIAKSRKYGINYGIAVNCGLKFPIRNDDQLLDFVDNFNMPEAFVAMQAEGREWTTLFSKEAMKKFDYVFTDGSTWTNDDGKRMRLWIKEEVEIGNKQDFMDMYVDRIVGILKNEPIDIYVNPTYLPEVISDEYDELWSDERMDKVIQAAVENKIAIEINARRRIPRPTFLKRAKEAGATFAFGTNNSSAEFGNLEYCLEMIEVLGLMPDDMFMPDK